MEFIVHGIVLLFLFVDVFSHYRDHNKKKRARKEQQLYTLDEACKIIAQGLHKVVEK